MRSSFICKMNHDAYIIMIGAFSMPLLLQAINKSTSAFLCLEKQQDRKWILLMTIDHNIVHTLASLIIMQQNLIVF